MEQFHRSSHHTTGFTQTAEFRFLCHKALSCLVFSPELPDTTKVHNIHGPLVTQFGSIYNSCFRIPNHEMVTIVEFHSPQDAKKMWGSHVEIDGDTYTLESTLGHSPDYVCSDVRGTSTTDILAALDKSEIAAIESIAVYRQKSNGPLVAIHVGERPQTAMFSITLICHNGIKLEFVRANAACLFCKEQHCLSACKTHMVMERSLTSPGGKIVLYQEVVGKLAIELGGIIERKLKKVSARAIDIANKWAAIQEHMESITWERLG
jgi:hypothetical protein